MAEIESPDLNASTADPDSSAHAPIERFEPERLRGEMVEAEHLGRYHWAAARAAGCEVLDAGSGTGYGAAIMAAAGATRCVGVDLAVEAVEEATRRWGGEGVEFQVADVTALPFPDGSFDLVTCFEVIEHVVEQEQVIRELARVLRPEGMMLISSPNRGEYPPGNPFHVRELTPEEARVLLSAGFGHVMLLRQHNWIASAILDDAGFESSDAASPLPAEVRKLAGRAPGTELYTLAACGHRPVEPPPAQLLVTHGLEVRRWLDGIEELLLARRALAAAEQELLELRDRRSTGMGELERQAYWLQRAQIDPDEWMRRAPVRVAFKILQRLRRLRRRLLGRGST